MYNNLPPPKEPPESLKKQIRTKGEFGALGRGEGRFAGGGGGGGGGVVFCWGGGGGGGGGVGGFGGGGGGGGGF